MISRDVERRNIPKGSRVELIYGDVDKESVYFEGVERNKKHCGGVDILLCKEKPNATRLITRNLEVIREIRVYERKR